MRIIQRGTVFLIKFKRRYRLLKWRVLSKLSFLTDGVVLAEAQGNKMYLDLNDRVHCEMLYTTGIWEPNETTLLKRIIKDGMVVIDIGANVGYYTLIAAAQVGTKGKVFSFEPEPSRYSLLRRNVAANNHTNITVVQKAVSNKTGKTRLYLNPRSNKGDHRLYDASDGRDSIPIDTITLDDFFKGNDCPIHVIKMDIQGAEMAALQGMANMIKRNHDLLLVTEFWPDGLKRFGFSPMEFLNTLTGHGFTLHDVKDQKQSIAPTDPERLVSIKGEKYLVCKKGNIAF